MPSGGATSGDRPQPPQATAAGGQTERRNGAARARAGRPGPNGEAVPVAVSWDERARRPVAFVWRRRRYQVERVLETWVLETGWWRDDGHVSRCTGGCAPVAASSTCATTASARRGRSSGRSDDYVAPGPADGTYWQPLKVA